jgi:hypothetical protein
MNVPNYSNHVDSDINYSNQVDSDINYSNHVYSDINCSNHDDSDINWHKLVHWPRYIHIFTIMYRNIQKFVSIYIYLECYLKLIWINNYLTFEQMMSERLFSLMTFKLCQYRFFVPDYIIHNNNRICNTSKSKNRALYDSCISKYLITIVKGTRSQKILPADNIRSRILS